MKINSDLQQILLQNDSTQTNKTLPQTQAEFAEILLQADSALENSEANASSFSTDTDYRTLSASNLAMINASLSGKLDETNADGSMQDYEQEIYTMAAMLDGLDAYAEKLTKTNSDKDAWQDLQNISAQAQNLKQKDLPDELKSLVSEIELLSTTEQFKMNRGDYEI